MNTSFLLSLPLVLCFCTLGFAETQVITLNDGSQIKGELVGVSNGIYTIKTPAMGQVTVTGGQVTSIKNESAAIAVPSPVTAPSNTGTAAQVQAVQTQLMGDPAFMTELQTMVTDPEFMELLKDPAVLQAVASKDPAALASSPGGQALMNNPKMQALIEKLQKK